MVIVDSVAALVPKAEIEAWLTALASSKANESG